MNQSDRGHRTRVKRALFTAAGTVFLVLGAAGVVVPLLPSTPFLLLSAACYVRGSERMHHWLLNNKWFGRYIRNYREGKGISAKSKVVALTVLWATIFFSAFYITDMIVVQVILFVVAVVVSAHIIRLPTFRKTNSL